MKRRFHMLGCAAKRVLQAITMVLAIAGVSLSSGCEDDPLVKEFPIGPDPTWWPGKPFADSVRYVDADSAILYGHFVSQQKSLSIKEYFFLVYIRGEGVSKDTVYRLAKDVTWTFPDLSIPVMSSAKICIPKGAGLTASFSLNIEIVNPKWRTGDPIGMKTYYLVSDKFIPIATD